MNIITTESKIKSLKSRDLIILECLCCKKHYQLSKHRVFDYKTKGGLRGSFCSKKCAGKFKSTVTINKCLYCGKEVIRTNKQLKNSNGHCFCNSSCSASYFNNLRKRPERACKNCNRNFFLSGHHNKIFCSMKCLRESRGFKAIVTTNLVCSECNKAFQRDSNKVNKRPFHFCSRSCQAKYANKTWNRAGRFGVNKSRAESDLVKIIKTDFPNLEIIENDRKLLNGLELDIYIPSKNIAVELNGPCHYIPIFGESELSKTQSKDVIKKQKMQDLKIHFFQINIMGAGKKLPSILESAYIGNIKPLL